MIGLTATAYFAGEVSQMPAVNAAFFEARRDRINETVQENCARLFLSAYQQQSESLRAYQWLATCQSNYIRSSGRDNAAAAR